MRDEFVSLGSAASAVIASIAAPNGVERFPIIDRTSWLRWRKQDVTASVAAAVFGEGVHPYMSSYNLWALKSGMIEEEAEETPAMRRGRLLEPVALDMLREERPTWDVKAGREYYRDPASRIGATPDSLVRRPEVEGIGTVQIKTVGRFAFEKGWHGDLGDVEIPLWVAIQAHTEAMLTGATWASVAAMVLGDGGIDLHILDVPIKPKLMTRLRDLVADFWRRVAENDPYAPDYGRDAALIARIYSADDGGEVDLSGNNRMTDLIATRRVLKDAEGAGSAAEKERKLIDAEIIHILGNASRGILADGTIVEAKTVRRKAYAVEASQYRAVRVKEGVRQ